MSKVSVIIPCYNLGKHLDEAVESVINQTYKDFEIIIVNDGSTDEYTNNLLKNYSKPKTVVYQTKNQGLPATRNYGIERSSGEYICCLDADDKYHSTFLEKCVKIFDDDMNDEYGIVTTNFQLFENSNQIIEVIDFNLSSIAVENKLHVASLFRKKSWNKVGGYATNLTGYQDWNFWLSIVAKGYKWYTVKDVLFYYRDRIGSMLKDSNKKRLSLTKIIIDNNKDFYFKNYFAILNEFINYNNDLLNYNNDLLEAKEWFLSQIENKDKYVNELLIKIKIKDEVIVNTQNQINQIYSSKTYRLGAIFKDVFKSPKKFLVFLIRFFWTFIPYKIKQIIKKTLFFKLLKKIFVDKSINNFIHKKFEKKYQIDFFDNFTYFKQLKEYHGFIIIESVNINDVVKNAILIHPPYNPNNFTELIIENIFVAKNTVFKSSIALKSQIWFENNGGGYFYIEIEYKNISEIIFEKYLDPRNIEEDRKWYDIVICLDKYKNKLVNFKLKTRNGGKDNFNENAWTIWGNSRFECSSFFRLENKNYWIEDYKNNKNIILKNKKWPKNKPLISVIIPCFNYGKYVEESIDCVLNQTFQNFEIIVVDGGSDDSNTIETLKRLNKPKTKIYFRKGRHLAGDNRNFGINKSKGKYICCLDADDMIISTYFKKALFFLENYYYDVIYPSVQCFGEKNEIWHAEPTDFIKNIEIGNHVSTVAIFRRSAWKKSGGYKDWPIGEGHVPEDWDFWTRLLGLGYRFKNLSDLLMLYRVHDNGLTAKCKTSIEKQKEIIKNVNFVYFQKKYTKKRNFMSNQNFLIKNSFENLKDLQKCEDNILVALPFVIIGGADTILLNILGYLRKNGFNITVVTTIETDPNFGDNSIEYEKLTNDIYHLYKFLPDSTQWKDFVYYLIEVNKINKILIVGCEFLYNMLPDIKEKYSYINIYDQLFNEFGHIANNRKYSSYINMNIVTSSLIKDTLINNYNENQDKIKVIIHGVDTLNEYNPDNYEFTNFKFRDDNRLIISYFGRLSEEKNPEFFVKIAKELKHLNIKFLLIGNGPLYNEISSLIINESLQDIIFFPGFVDSIKPYLYESDIIVVPSKIEGIPIIILESMAFGKTVIASSVGGIPSVITSGKNGYLCNSEDVNDFIERIKSLYNNRKLLVDISKNAREYALINLDIEKMYKEYIEILKN